MVFELEPLHVRQVDDLQREDRRVDAVGLDEVLDRRGEVEQHAFVLVARRISPRTSGTRSNAASGVLRTISDACSASNPESWR